MAEFMVLFGAAPDEIATERELVEQIEAFLPIQFPDDQFRFALAPDRAGVAVVPIAGHQEPLGGNFSEIALAIEAIVRQRSRSAAL